MKILALNSSPRSGGHSKTELMLNSLVEGMRDAGADVEIVPLRKKNIKSCVGCLTCLTTTPGECAQKDDMSKELFHKWIESDIAVYATPLYNYTMNSTLKVFIERTLPSIHPSFKIQEGRIFHPLRNKNPAIVVLSVSGMPDDNGFNAMSAHMNYLLATPGRKLAAEIYRSAAETMPFPFLKKKTLDILSATTQGGRELVQSMKISPETMVRITQPLVEAPLFAEVGNLLWKTYISEGVKPKEFANKKIVPRPDSLKSFMFIFPFGLKSEAVGDKNVILQFKFSGIVEDSCYFTIKKENVDTKIGISEKPDLTIDAPFDMWMDIMTGKVNGQQMLMEQKYKAHGDITLMSKLF